MASSKDYVASTIEQLNIATGGDVSSRAMMGSMWFIIAIR